jgi:integration host factor subunit beta
VTKKDIAGAIAAQTGASKSLTMDIMQQVLDGIIEVLVTEGRIELRNFGVFEVKKRKAKQARNPRTGAKVQVPERFVVKFKPGEEMMVRVAQLTNAPSREVVAATPSEGAD